MKQGSKLFDRLYKSPVTYIREGGPGAERCVVVRDSSGHTYLQFRNLLRGV